jgi:hypothetical protein
MNTPGTRGAKAKIPNEIKDLHSPSQTNSRQKVVQNEALAEGCGSER